MDLIFAMKTEFFQKPALGEWELECFLRDERFPG
jgi:hypothetical protein